MAQRGLHVLFLSTSFVLAACSGLDSSDLNMFALGSLAQHPTAFVQTSDSTSIQPTTVITLCNGIMLACVSMVIFKLWWSRQPGIDLLSRQEAAEDMSIGKALPSVIVWVSLGITLICFNKYMYLPKEQGGFDFPYPLALTWWHMFTGLIATNVVRRIRPELMPAVTEGRLSFHGFLTGVLPIGVVFAVYLAVGNSAYLYLSVSFVQMLKSAGPMFVFTVSVAFGMERLTVASVVAVSIVVMGIAGATVGEMAFSWFGFFLQFTAFVLDGFRNVLFKLLVSSRGAKLDPLSGLYYFSPVCVLTLIWPVIHFEGATLWTTLSQASPWLYAIIVLNGCVAFSLNFSMLALFANASATTVSMASVMRDVFLTFGTAILFHSTITRVQILGYLSACVGVKMWDEMKARPDAFYKALGMNGRREQLPLRSE